MKKYIMGIDNGSQSTKVSIFDLAGNEVVYSAVPLKELHTPEPGVVEHPNDDLWHSVKKAIKQCLEKFDGDKQQIVAIGLCTIRCCRVLLKEDGTLASPVISWMDVRLNKPYIHEDDRVKFVTTTSGYINYCLTGEKADCAANYEVHWPLDHMTLDWIEDDHVLEEFGLRRDMLFRLVVPGERLGYLKKELVNEFGLNRQIPIVASANDKAVDVLGAGIKDDKTCMISLGTFISAMVLRDEYFDNAKNFFPTYASIPFQYVYETNGIRRGMWTVTWFKKIIGEELVNNAKKRNCSEEDLLNAMAENIPIGSDGLITILDWLPPPHAPYRKGMMIGFDQRHTRYHIYRSILEAIAFTIFNNLEEMLNEAGGTIEKIIINGGGAKSDVLAQIIADVFGLPVIRRKGNSSSALGAAICAAVNMNLFNTFDDAIESMVQTEKVFEPHEEHHNTYSLINETIVKNMKVHTDEVLKLHHRIFN